jgi:hypothetical protein
MQKFLLAATAVASIALFAPPSEAEGQSNNEPAVATAPRTVNLTAEQRFIIKEIVLKDLNVPKARAGAPESIGDLVPSNVELARCCCAENSVTAIPPPAHWARKMPVQPI